MNRRQKEVLQNELKNERTVLNQINAVYQRAMIDIEAKIEKMQARISMNRKTLLPFIGSSSRKL